MAKEKKLALVLGCGGIRGLAQISTIEYMESIDLRPDMIIGVSIGSVIGALYSCGMLDEFKEDFLKLKATETVKFFYPSLSRSGLFNTDNFLKMVKRYIPKDAQLEKLPIPLTIIATNYQTGEQVCFSKGNVLNAIRASVSIPGFFVPVKYHEGLLVDGAVANPLPIDLAREMGATSVIAINLYPAKSIKKENKTDSASDVLVIKSEIIDEKNDSFGFIFRNKYFQHFIDKIKNPLKSDTTKVPNLIEMMMQSMEISIHHATKTMIKHHKPDVLIEPLVLDIMVLDVSKSKKVLEEGIKACEKAKPELMKLKKKLEK